LRMARVRDALSLPHGSQSSLEDQAGRKIIFAQSERYLEIWQRATRRVPCLAT
jgi:hypothetical protein